MIPERVGKPVVWLAAGAPLAWLVHGAFTGGLGPEPIDTLTKWTGTTALIILMTTLAVTPLRRLTGWNRLVKYRRLLGLWAFSYAVLHFLVWALFDHEFTWSYMWEDISERPYITVGTAALLILLALAITSPKGMVRRLGGKRWQALHRMVYVAAALAVLHFLWLVKADLTNPLIFAVVLITLLVARLPRRGRPGATAPSAAPVPDS
jgi:sulfoxide reductase heme-binding subunit YedZ